MNMESENYCGEEGSKEIESVVDREPHRIANNVKVRLG